MFMSSADVFRTRQAVADLLQVVHLHRNAVLRIGASGADRDSLERIVQNSAIIPDEKGRSYTSILLAAALPDEDFNAFILSTAILLADRLQSGGGDEDLYWNFDAFHDHYLLADAPVRAALMNGFRVAHETGKANLSHVPNEESCLTRSEKDVVQILRSEKSDNLVGMLATIPTPAQAGSLWFQAADTDLNFAELVAYRFLYERDGSMDLQQADTAALIPWT